MKGGSPHDLGRTSTYRYSHGHGHEEQPITRILGRLPPAERARRRAELAAVGRCDVLISRWRWGAAYVRVVRERRTVATLAWLLFLLMPVNAPGTSHNGAAGAVQSARPAPTEQLLHYPVSKGFVEGFEKHVVTVTNYTGEAGENLKKLITAMGGTFTPCPYSS
ncbi:hypothetical protein D9619_012823 [Psilocybe cf. subviscida]|uniref:Uncharacterized protein n=1 Tax=Psilocybe cf. subviscida TaxID=2480587 RepID=A0A8H5EQN2_9AGAR|nr:hypothetical protein D9619_012823 [Psilocybe cf. subviscida]